MSSAILESAWLNRTHYEGAMDAYHVFKATGKTAQVRLSPRDWFGWRFVESVTGPNQTSHFYNPNPLI